MKTYFRFVHIIPLLIVTILDCVTPTPYYHTDKDGRRYLIEIEKNYNWLEAFDQCALRGTQLVVIDNLTKNSALVSLLTSVYGNAQQMWIGHHDEFGTSKAKDRPFYSAETRFHMAFGLQVIPVMIRAMNTAYISLTPPTGGTISHAQKATAIYVKNII